MAEPIVDASIPATPPSIINRIRGLLGGGFGTVTTGYGDPAALTGAFHSGVDFAAPYGAPIRLPVGGVVSRVWSDATGGTQVAVKTASGFTQVFAHLSSIGQSATWAKTGALIPAGAVVGNVGNSGMATGPHLHYEVVKPGGSIGTQAGTIDPSTFISEFGALSDPSTATGPAPLPEVLVKQIRSTLAILGTAVLAGKMTEADAAAQLQKDYPNVPLAQLHDATVSYATDNRTSFDPQAIPVLGGIAGAIARTIGYIELPGEEATHTSGNPLDALGSVAADISRLTGDVTNPQTWARVALTAAGVGLIVVGLLLYAGGLRVQGPAPVVVGGA